MMKKDIKDYSETKKKKMKKKWIKKELENFLINFNQIALILTPICMIDLIDRDNIEVKNNFDIYIHYI